MVDRPKVVYTVGHSNQSLEAFRSLLRTFDIGQVVDVRSVPFSRFSPQFSQRELRASLSESGVSYIFLGRELGARPDDRDCYVDGRVHYDLLAKRSSFSRGLDTIEGSIQSASVCLMCTEQDPIDCHRAILVATALDLRGILVQHIHRDARLESHADAVSRLRRVWGLDTELFRSEAELDAQALAWQEEKIAFREPNPREQAWGDL